MADPYLRYKPSLESPPDCHDSITPSDSVDLPTKYKCIFCTAAGDVVVRDANGTDQTYAMTVNQILPFRPTRILATGTTGTVKGWYDSQNQ